MSQKFNAEYSDFIGIYRDVFPSDFCSYVIENFDILVQQGAAWSRKETENQPALRKADVALCGVVNNFTPYKLNNDTSISFQRAFYGGLQECFNLYEEKYSSLCDNKLTCHNIKIQKTEPGEGYHIWHHEKGGQESRRVVTYMLYLNTLEPEQAGETEFLYQQKRIRPTENTVVLWPAAYTHTHRGNTVFGEKSKYIVTGWFYIDEI